jgi:hypothetical protein
MRLLTIMICGVILLEKGELMEYPEFDPLGVDPEK